MLHLWWKSEDTSYKTTILFDYMQQCQWPHLDSLVALAGVVLNEVWHLRPDVAVYRAQPASLSIENLATHAQPTAASGEREVTKNA